MNINIQLSFTEIFCSVAGLDLVRKWGQCLVILSGWL